MSYGNGSGRSGLAAPTQPGALVKQEILGSTQMQIASETNVQAAEAEAMVKARCALARTMPRNIELVRQRLLNDCKRPGFAEAAIYRKPVGKEWNPKTKKEEQKTIDGPSVRFAEAVARHMGNMLVDATVAEDTPLRRRVRVSVMDLETNTTACADVVIEKTVERKWANDREIISERKNSNGGIVYLLKATEDEVLNKTNAAVSKMRRNKILELTAADIADEAEALCLATMKQADAADPDSAKRKLIDAFSKVGVDAIDLQEYLDHDLNTVTADELSELRKIHAGLRDGEMEWRSVMEPRLEARKGAAPASTAPPAAPVAKADGLPPHDPKTGVIIEDPAVLERLRASDAAAKAAAVAVAATAQAPKPHPAIDFAAPDAPEKVRAGMQKVADDPEGTAEQLMKAAALVKNLPNEHRGELDKLYLELRKVVGGRSKK